MKLAFVQSREGSHRPFEGGTATCCCRELIVIRLFFFCRRWKCSGGNYDWRAVQTGTAFGKHTCDTCITATFTAVTVSTMAFSFKFFFWYKIFSIRTVASFVFCILLYLVHLLVQIFSIFCRRLFIFSLFCREISCLCRNHTILLLCVFYCFTILIYSILFLVH